MENKICNASNTLENTLRNEKENDKSFNKICIVHYNCRGMTWGDRIYELERAVSKIDWDIIRLSEIRREGEKLVRRKNGNYWYYCGERKGYRGVRLYIKGKIWSKVEAVKMVSERICGLKLAIGGGGECKLVIIQVYLSLIHI